MNKIDIVLISDDNYSLPARVAINSIIRNNSKYLDIEINIIGVELSSENINQFCLMSTSLVKISVLNKGNEYSHLGKEHPFVSKAALFKFEIPNIFPEKDKILYLDCDIIVTDDISQLFEIDITDFYAAAVKDMAATVTEKHNEKMNHLHYFNTGVTLLNLSKMRTDDITSKLFLVKTQGKFEHFMDQDEFNFVFEEKVKFISPAYNLMAANLNYEIKDIADFYGLPEFQMSEVLKKPIILHLTNMKKTWNTTRASKFEHWFKYVLPEDLGLCLKNYFSNYIEISDFKNMISETDKKMTYIISQLEQKLAEAEQTTIAAETRAQEAEAHANKSQTDLDVVQAANHRHWQLADARAQQIQAIYQSHSWRITAPVRWCGHQVRLVRQHALALRLKALLKKIVRFLIKCVIAFLGTHPGLRHRCVAIAQRFGIYNYLRSFYFRCYGQQDPMNSSRVLGRSADFNLTVDQLTPRARQIYVDLKAAIERRQRDDS